MIIIILGIMKMPPKEEVVRKLDGVSLISLRFFMIILSSLFSVPFLAGGAI